MDEFTIKIRIQNSMQCVMDETIADLRFMNVAWFWVVYFEWMIGTVTIGFVF